MNQVTIIGNLTKDVELKRTQSGKAFARFTVAASRTIETNGEKKELTDFIPVVAWGFWAEGAAARLKKGSRAIVQGRYTSRSYEAQDGSKRYVTEIAADFIGEPVSVPKQSAGGFSQFGTPQEDIPF